MPTESAHRSSTSVPGGLWQRIPPTVLLFATLSIANAANYLFQVVMGRWLGPADYGLLGGVYAVMTVVAVSTTALQTSSAKAVAAGWSEASGTARDPLSRATLKWGVAVGLLMVVASPALAAFLRTDSAPVVMLGLYVPPTAVLAVAMGRLQGMHAFGFFAAVSIAMAVGRLVLAPPVLLAGFGVTGIVALSVLVTAGGCIAALVGSRPAGAVPLARVRGEIMRAGVALGLLWLMVSVDVPVARFALDPNVAGQYAAAAVVGKAVLWLPSAISLVMFPRVAQLRDTGRDTIALLGKAMASTAVLCVVAVVLLWAAGPHLLPLVFGPDYAEVGRLTWMVALAFVPFAIANVLIYYHLTRSTLGFAGALFVGLAGQLLLLWVRHDSVVGIVTSMAAAGMMVLIGLTAPGALRRSRATASRHAAHLD